MVSFSRQLRLTTIFVADKQFSLPRILTNSVIVPCCCNEPCKACKRMTGAQRNELLVSRDKCELEKIFTGRNNRAYIDRLTWMCHLIQQGRCTPLWNKANSDLKLLHATVVRLAYRTKHIYRTFPKVPLKGTLTPYSKGTLGRT